MVTGPMVTGGAPIRPTLLHCQAERFSGLVHLDGDVGGWLCFEDGLVVAASTPAAPGPESLLLKSGRIAEPDWTGVYDAAAASGRMAAELVRRGLIGEVGLEVVCLTALFDAGFAMAAYGVGTCRVEPAGPDMPEIVLRISPGVEPERLLKETTRRMRAASSWRRVGVTVRSRPFPVTGALASHALDEGRARDVLQLANGRRTPRDIAFAVGRGLFAVMDELARLVGEGHLDPGAPARSGGSRPQGRGAGTTDPGPDTAADTEAEAERLPQRRKGASKINEVLPVPSIARPLLRRLRPVRPVPISADGENEPLRGRE